MVFKDHHLESDFRRQGFVTLPMLTAEECVFLLKYYQENSEASSTGFHCTMFNQDVSFRKKVDFMIKQVIGPKLDRVLNDQYPLYGNFMVKESGKASDWYVHQDWTYVDEAEHTSVAVWVPLVDLSEENGPICMVPGSHQFENTVRGPGVTDPFTDLHEVIRSTYHSKLLLRAGEAVIWHHRTAHFSPANMTTGPRVAATIICVPKSAKVFHYWQDPENREDQAERFIVNSDFFMKYRIGERPDGVPSSGFFDSSFDSIQEGQLVAAFGKANSLNSGPLERIKQFFKL